MSRPSWKGFLKLSLVSVPVVSYPAVRSIEGEVHFHQLHDKCHNRIKYVKTCPQHGPVSNDEIVSGYEFEKGHYVVVEKGELEALRSGEEKTVEMESIIAADALDPIYLTDHSFYLVPDGRVAQKPYAVIEQCLREQKPIAIGRRVLNGKDEVVMLRPAGRLLLMTVLNSAAQVKAAEPFEQELADVDISASEMKLTRTLFDAFYQDKVDLTEFKDHYNERLTELIDAKVQGRQQIKPPLSEHRDVINLMDALKQSLATKSKRSIKPGSNETEVARLKRSIIAQRQKKTKRA